MQIRVLILRARLPFNLGVLIRDLPGLVLYYIDVDLMTQFGADLLQASMNAYVGYWDRVDEPDPTPVLIKVAV